MQKNLVIVESPAKAKTIEKFLGQDYKVMSSYGHIRDLKKKDLSVNIETFEPIYEIPSDKKKIVSALKEAAKNADTVWLASDEDREGEAISWHLFETLDLKQDSTKRIVFHEITKNAILQAIENPRDIDINLVYSQQARRVLDRLVGFKLSPVLWRKIKPSLSAGRVQSVAVRLIVEREREIRDFVSEASYKVSALFKVKEPDGSVQEVKADYSERFRNQEEAEEFLEKCKSVSFNVVDVTKKPIKKIPAPPFTTSTMQQEATRKFGFTVMQTMMLAQRLYESGLITYMRTDSVNLSKFSLALCRSVIEDVMGEEYSKPRQYTQKAKGAQEAHEAIRPTYMENQTIEGTAPERRLYELIWKRTIASQMSDADIEKTTVTISSPDIDGDFIVTGEVVKFDGFLRVYRESRDDDVDTPETHGLPDFTIGETLEYSNILAFERFTQQPPRYNEAALVHKLEELGIGRPSTYAPTIGTIQQREYVIRENIEGKSRNSNVLRLESGKIEKYIVSETYGTEKSKLLPTDIGIVVNDFLMEYFPEIMNYNFTARVEKEFDDIADGKKEWQSVISRFYEKFSPSVENAMSTKHEHKVGERFLGISPFSGKPVSVKIGRYGPIVQIGSAEDDEKPKFAQLKRGQSLETITLEEALKLFSLPRVLGEFEGKPVVVSSGRFGPYVNNGSLYVSLKEEIIDPLELSYDDAVKMILNKREMESKKVIKSFPEDPEIEIMNGRYGAYIAYKGSNYRIPKNMEASELSLDECMEIIRRQIEKTGSAPKRRIFKTKK
ncbi:MAG: type I DNA topoisomerase [Bacteroidaceae bacterium]|jgi:DNA topoisomerase-1|nr:type I DNA topoisomerase [Bacteroidaceae bacterium]HOD69115.1 type I DNA topoisomerase [Bacteroidaceae bacterium]